MEFITSNSYMGVGKKAELSQRALVKYLYYMRTRWKDTEEQKSKDGYAGEWALRFKHGAEYSASDAQGQALLRSIGYQKSEVS